MKSLIAIACAVIAFLFVPWPPAGPTAQDKPSQLAQPIAPLKTDLPDVTPLPEHREIAQNLFRLMVIHLENYAAGTEISADPSVEKFSKFMNNLPPAHRDKFVQAARKFGAQPEFAKKTFFGSFYAPTPQARLKSVPILLRTFQGRENLIYQPQFLLKKRIRLSSSRPSTDWTHSILAFQDGARPLFLAPTAAYAAPGKTTYARIKLKSIRVISQNDDDTPTDEVYLFVLSVGAFATETERAPNGDTYWEIGPGQTRSFDRALARYRGPAQNTQVSAFVSVFEYDDGNWGDIWEAFVGLAEFGFEMWLQAEIGSVLTQVVMYFLDSLFDWISEWFSNPDDYIGTFCSTAWFQQGKKVWNESGTSTAKPKVYRVRGEDADYQISCRWYLTQE